MFKIPITRKNITDILKSNCYYCNSKFSDILTTKHDKITIVEDSGYLIGYCCDECERKVG